MDNPVFKRRDPSARELGSLESDSLFAELVERANDLFIVIGREGRITFVNPSYCGLTGYASEEVVGEKFVGLIEAASRQVAQSRLTHALHSGGKNPIDLPLAKKEGGSVEISFRTYTEREPDGMVRQMIFVGQSPHLYGELAEQFNSLNRDLKNYSRQLERLNVELEERIEERTARLAALLEVSASLNAELQLDALFELVLRQATETIPGAEAGVLLLYDPEADRLVIQAACGYEDPAVVTDLQTELERVHPESIFSDRMVRVWSSGESRAKSGQMRMLLRNVDQFRIRSAISAPIATPSEKLGVLLLHNFGEPDAFEDDDVQLAASLAGSAAVAIINARLYEQTQQQAERLELVNRLSAAVRDSVDLEQTIRIAVEGAGRVLGASRAAITLLDEATDLPVFFAQYSEPGLKELKGPSFLLDTPLMRETIGFREPRAVTEARHDPRIAEAGRRVSEYGLESLLLAPLAVRERFIGMLEIHQCDRQRRWRDPELALVESVTKQVATAIHQNRLYAKLRETAREAEALYRAASILNETSDLNELLARILDAVAEELGHPRGAIMLVDDARERLFVKALKDHPIGALADAVPIDGPGIASYVVRAREAVNVPDVTADERSAPQWRECRSELAAPLMIDGEVIGVLDLQSSEPTAFSERDQRVLVSFAERAASAIRQARLFEMVRRGKREWEASVDAMPEAVFIFGRGGLVRRVNTGAARLVGRSFQELLGVRCCAIFGAGAGADGCIVEAAMRSGERSTSAWAHAGREIGVTVNPIVTEEGAVAGAVVVAVA